MKCPTVHHTHKSTPKRLKNKTKKDETPKYAVLWNKFKVETMDFTKAATQASRRGDSMKVFITKEEAKSFATEKRKENSSSKKSKPSPRTTSGRKKPSTNTDLNDAATEASTTATDNARQKRLRQKFEKRLLNKTGNKIEIKHKHIEEADMIVMIIDICRETIQDDELIRRVRSINFSTGTHTFFFFTNPASHNSLILKQTDCMATSPRCC